MKKTILLATLFVAMIVIGCDKNPLSPDKQDTMIRLKTGSGLNNGAQIYFIALSKNTDFSTLPGSIFDYDKTKSDWYIDGGEIPFTTAYKKFTKSTGSYYFLIKANGMAVMSTITVKEEKQTWLIKGTSAGYGPGTLRIDVEQP